MKMQVTMCIRPRAMQAAHQCLLARTHSTSLYRVSNALAMAYSWAQGTSRQTRECCICSSLTWLSMHGQRHGTQTAACHMALYGSTEAGLTEESPHGCEGGWHRGCAPGAGRQAGACTMLRYAAGSVRMCVCGGGGSAV